MTPTDHFWHREALQNRITHLINQLYKLEYQSGEWKNTLFKLGILEEESAHVS